MMTGNPVVDINVDPLDVARRRRRLLLRIGIPVGGVALMVATILLIAFYSYRANSDGVLALSNDLLATLEQRIGIEISGYLAPPARAVRILRDTLHGREFGDRLALVETVGGSLLERYRKSPISTPQTRTVTSCWSAAGKPAATMLN